MKQIKLYMGHAIRGIKGINATETDMKANNLAAIRAVRVMRAYLHPLPVEIYCPGENDAFVMIAHKRNFLNEEQILDVDCQIVGECDAFVFYAALGPSKGAEIEMNYARHRDMPVFDMLVLNETYLTQLEKFVEGLCRESS